MRITNSLSVATLLIFLPARAYAVQHHGGAEGLVSHLIGHVLFLTGIIIFIAWIIKHHDRGWPAFKKCLGFLLAWNILTASGHILDEFQDPARIIRSGGRIIAYRADNLIDFYFYLTRLDHLLLVPAFIFLLMAILRWRGNGDALETPEMTTPAGRRLEKKT